jgi:hypothetical protein
MNADRLRTFGKLPYVDPKYVLEELRRIEMDISGLEIPERVRTLRTNILKPEREVRDAAIFSYGISCVQGHDVLFAPIEDQDFDFVTTWVSGDTRHFAPVQLKELVPEELNRQASIDDLLSRLSKYSGSTDVTFAIKMTRAGRFEPAEVRVPGNLSIGGLWMYAAISPDQDEWALWGDFTKPGPTLGMKFEYPKPMRLLFG